MKYDINKLIPIKNIQKKKNLVKPNWIKIKLPVDNKKINKMKSILKKNKLITVCENALCPNLPECFNNKTATFMILGNICTRSCPFCAIKNGRPNIVDKKEPLRLAQLIYKLKLKYVVLTSVNRDDLKDAGALHFANCIKEIRKINGLKTKIEILVPDFRKKINIALQYIVDNTPDVFNHNIESIPRLYKKIRPGANYYNSLKLLKKFNKLFPNIPTKSGLMVGLGETKSEIIKVLIDLLKNNVSMLTIGQYLQPSKNHLPVVKYYTPYEFSQIQKKAISMGFAKAYCGVFVRSSYHASKQIIV
ncbi:lipoyl synthase [Buchnera aphidicola (Mollitrichosiphum nigrofasciatum)]|uniref:lipoyl synthase n=1 Tax=Buchnera aphidicola TaxID=9 RepID=UPI0031B8807A